MQLRVRSITYLAEASTGMSRRPRGRGLAAFRSGRYRPPDGGYLRQYLCATTPSNAAATASRCCADPIAGAGRLFHDAVSGPGALPRSRCRATIFASTRPPGRPSPDRRRHRHCADDGDDLGSATAARRARSALLRSLAEPAALPQRARAIGGGGKPLFHYDNGVRRVASSRGAARPASGRDPSYFCGPGAP